MSGLSPIFDFWSFANLFQTHWRTQFLCLFQFCTLFAFSILLLLLLEIGMSRDFQNCRILFSFFFFFFDRLHTQSYTPDGFHPLPTFGVCLLLLFSGDYRSNRKWIHLSFWAGVQTHTHTHTLTTNAHAICLRAFLFRDHTGIVATMITSNWCFFLAYLHLKIHQWDLFSCKIIFTMIIFPTVWIQITGSNLGRFFVCFESVGILPFSTLHYCRCCSIPFFVQSRQPL